MKKYKGLNSLPYGRASEITTEGCLVLEGGGWKGLYTVGVLDCMMRHDINLRSTVGVSAGALAAVSYLSGQIGRSARVDLTYRHDKNFCGVGALRRDKGITGFSYMYNEVEQAIPLDRERLMKSERRLAVSATNMLSGKVEYFEKGNCDLFLAAQASATVPFISKPVMIDGVPYIDGGCGEKIPMSWALRSGERKLVVVRTRELGYRRDEKPSKLTSVFYGKYPNFVRTFNSVNAEFNSTVDKLERQAQDGRIFLMAPSEPVTVSRFDGDMDKLGALYWLGYRDMEKRIDELKEFLK